MYVHMSAGAQQGLGCPGARVTGLSMWVPEKEPGLLHQSCMSVRTEPSL